MKFIYWTLLVLMCCGCTTPVIIRDGTQTRAFIPCAEDYFCFRDAYNIAWDDWCTYGSKDFPVSYRSKQFEYNADATEFVVTSPAKPKDTACGGAPCQ